MKRMRLSWMTLPLLLLAMCLAQAQSWSDAYERGLSAAKQQRWADAREAFKLAAAGRPEDVSGPTLLPGPVTDQRTWRRGAPYSPNLGAAYAAYRGGLETRDPEERDALFRAAASELEALIDRGQHAKATYFFLGQAFVQLRDAEGQARLDGRFAQMSGRMNWRVDLEIVTPDERAAISDAFGDPSGAVGDPTQQDIRQPEQPPAQEPGPVVEDPSRGQGTWHPPLVMQPETEPQNPLAPPPTTTGTSGLTRPVGRTAPVGNKFALIVGNAETKLSGFEIPWAANDATAIRDALIQHAGYPSQNVDVIANATVEQMRASAQALAERMPDGATVTIYFTGVGVNLDGEDFLAGTDSAGATDSSTMLSKEELYRFFITKGARVFAFFQVNRPELNGAFFGSQVLPVGMIAQMHATRPGGVCNAMMRNGTETGVFTDAFVRVLADFRSNRINITEFAWAVFNAMRRSGTGAAGGSSTQTMTLPVITNMATDARF